MAATGVWEDDELYDRLVRGIGLSAAKKTLRVTTQSGIRNVYAPAERKLRQRTTHLNFPNLRGRWYTDTLFSKVKSIRGNKGAQVFTNGKGFDCIYPHVSKSCAGEGLTRFIQDVGVPQTLVMDGAMEQIGRQSEMGKVCRAHHIEVRPTVPYQPWKNLAESAIRINKSALLRTLRRTRAPRRTWCYALMWVSAIRRLTASDIPGLDGRTPTEAVLGPTPDISAYAMFDYFQTVKYYTPTAHFPFQKVVLGKFLGVCEVSIDELTFYVLTDSGRVVQRKSVWALTDDEEKIMVIEINNLEVLIAQKIGDSLEEDEVDESARATLPTIPEQLFDTGDDVPEPMESDASRPEEDDYSPEAFDEYLTAEVLLPRGGETARAVVMKRLVDPDGKPVGSRHSNPMLDTRQYEVEFPDGSRDSFTANMIAENLFSQVDEEGKSFAVMDSIVDHRKTDKALSRREGYTIDKRTGAKRKRHTTAGWEFQVEWRDGSTTWVPLKDLKESNPVEVAEYAVVNGLTEEPAFAWWANWTLRKRDRILKKVKSRYWKRTHKFGVELPKSVEQALEIDRRTNTDFWRKAIEKEMKNVMPAFEFRDDDKMPIGHKHIDCHMIFDVKLVGLVRKARFVAGGHQTDPPTEPTYSSVVSRDSVRIAFLVAALNGCDILSADVQNAYLNAPTREKVYTTAGLEFGASNVGRPVLIVRALYGLSSSGARWRDHMAATLREAHFVSSKGDPDVWMRPATKPDGSEYYEYVLVYVDDILVVSCEPKEVMDYLATKYTLKEGSVKEPTTYLGADIVKYQIAESDEPSKVRWAMSSGTYVKRAISDLEKELEAVGQHLKKRVTTPISPGYRPELDTTNELDAKRATYFQGLIGVLRWICELGRIDILVEVSMLSHFLANPRDGHLEQALHCFAYLKQHTRSTLVFDDSEPTFENEFQECDWSEYYPGAKEAVPPGAPECRGRSVSMSCFVDADHAGDRATRRSHSGVLIFLNRAPIIWYSKRQNTVETSTFGSEFIAMRQAVELIEGLRYKLRMMGIEVEGATRIFCDNESVVKNASRPESTLKKKHVAIAYHRVREAQAAGIVRVAFEAGDYNLADILTKPLPGPRKRELASRILW